MPRQKDLKRLVRARMKKTGEAYTAARAQITKKARAKTPNAKIAGGAAARAAAPPPQDYAALAGMADSAVKEKTGCTWERWVKALDYHGAEQMSHKDIAAFVHSKYKVDGWWAQTVTVGYERIKGLRARGQRRDGTYEASKSRTFNVPVATLYDAWADPKIRVRWLADTSVTVRTATAPKSMRLGLADRSIIAVGFYPKGAGKSSVALAQTKVPDKATADRLKRYWSEKLDALGEVLRTDRE